MARLYNNIPENLKRIRFEIGEAAARYNREPGSVRLMAVTKTVPPEAVNEAVSLGVNLLGENKAQELCAKYEAYNKNGVEIHFIGALQSNKVRQIIDKVSIIHSVDRFSLAKEVSAQAVKAGKTVGVLFEVNIGGEATKSGVEPEKLEELAFMAAELPNISPMGLMAIPPICDSQIQIERYFYHMRQLLVDIRAKNIDNVHMDILSMGMSGDFIPAIKHGATIIRVGTAIFGTR